MNREENEPRRQYSRGEEVATNDVLMQLCARLGLKCRNTSELDTLKLNAVFSVCYAQYHESADNKWRLWGCARDVTAYTSGVADLPRYVMYAHEEGPRHVTEKQRFVIEHAAEAPPAAGFYETDFLEHEKGAGLLKALVVERLES